MIEGLESFQCIVDLLLNMNKILLNKHLCLHGQFSKIFETFGPITVSTTQMCSYLSTVSLSSVNNKNFLKSPRRHQRSGRSSIVNKENQKKKSHALPAPSPTSRSSHCRFSESKGSQLFKLKKVLTNEKRGGLTVVTFDRSPFKLLSRKFSNKFVQAPSCERSAQILLKISA
jgi:hypothetical protein